MPGIFISYRRGETQPHAGRLYDRLSAEFGARRVFIDLSIDPGEDFPKRIEEAVSSADVLLVVIGPDWLNSKGPDGRRRLEQPDDFVRREILGALEHSTTIVPVLVLGAQMPSPAGLGDALTPLAWRNAIALPDGQGWAAGVDRLIATLRPIVGRDRRLRRLLVAGGVAVVALGAATQLVARGGERDPETPPPGSGLRLQGPDAEISGYPFNAARAGGKIWVSSDDEGRLKVIDARTRAVTETASLGKLIGGLLAYDGRLLVGAYGDSDKDGKGSVVQVDPATGRPVGRRYATVDPLEIAADDRTIWVVDALQDKLQRIDRRRGRAGPPIPVDEATDVAILDGVAWVTSPGQGGRVLAFDAMTGRLARRPIDVGAEPLSLAAAAGALWVATGQGRLVRVSPDSGRLETMVVGGEGFRVVAADDRGVWVVDYNGNVVMVDPRRTSRRAELRLQGNLQGLALDGGGAWVLRAQSAAASSVARVVPAAGD